MLTLSSARRAPARQGPGRLSTSKTSASRSSAISIPALQGIRARRRHRPQVDHPAAVAGEGGSPGLDAVLPGGPRRSSQLPGCRRGSTLRSVAIPKQPNPRRSPDRRPATARSVTDRLPRKYPAPCRPRARATGRPWTGLDELGDRLLAIRGHLDDRLTVSWSGRFGAGRDEVAVDLDQVEGQVLDVVEGPNPTP